MSNSIVDLTKDPTSGKAVRETVVFQDDSVMDLILKKHYSSERLNYSSCN